MSQDLSCSLVAIPPTGHKACFGEVFPLGLQNYKERGRLRAFGSGRVGRLGPSEASHNVTQYANELAKRSAESQGHQGAQKGKKRKKHGVGNQRTCGDQSADGVDLDVSGHCHNLATSVSSNLLPSQGLRIAKPSKVQFERQRLPLTPPIDQLRTSGARSRMVHTVDGSLLSLESVGYGNLPARSSRRSQTCQTISHCVVQTEGRDHAKAGGGGGLIVSVENLSDDILVAGDIGIVGIGGQGGPDQRSACRRVQRGTVGDHGDPSKLLLQRRRRYFIAKLRHGLESFKLATPQTKTVSLRSQNLGDHPPQAPGCTVDQDLHWGWFGSVGPGSSIWGIHK